MARKVISDKLLVVSSIRAKVKMSVYALGSNELYMIGDETGVLYISLLYEVHSPILPALGIASSCIGFHCLTPTTSNELKSSLCANRP